MWLPTHLEPGVPWVLWRLRGDAHCVQRLCVYTFFLITGPEPLSCSQRAWRLRKETHEEPRLLSLLSCAKQKEWGLDLTAHPPFLLRPSTYSQVPWLPQAPPVEFPMGECSNPPLPPDPRPNTHQDFRAVGQVILEYSGGMWATPTPRQRTSLFI